MCWICRFSFFFFSSIRRHTRYWRDWGSDVGSSDLVGGGRLPDLPPECPRERALAEARAGRERGHGQVLREMAGDPGLQIGRASCRERVEISAVAVPLKIQTRRTPYIVSV